MGRTRAANSAGSLLGNMLSGGQDNTMATYQGKKLGADTLAQQMLAYERKGTGDSSKIKNDALTGLGDNPTLAELMRAGQGNASQLADARGTFKNTNLVDEAAQAGRGGNDSLANRLTLIASGKTSYQPANAQGIVTNLATGSTQGNGLTNSIIGNNNAQAGERSAHAGLYGEQANTQESVRAHNRAKAELASQQANTQSSVREANMARAYASRKNADKAPSRGITMTSPDGTVMQVGGQRTPITKKITNDLQKDIIGAEKSLIGLQSVADTFSKDYLTLWGRSKAKMGAAADVVGMEGEYVDFNSKRQMFVDHVKQYFNQYKKEITGSAAGVQEMEGILNSMFNETRSPDEFKKTFNSFVSKINQELALKRETLMRGVNMDASTAPYIGDRPENNRVKPQQVSLSPKQLNSLSTEELQAIVERGL